MMMVVGHKEAMKHELLCFYVSYVAALMSKTGRWPHSPVFFFRYVSWRPQGKQTNELVFVYPFNYPFSLNLCVYCIVYLCLQSKSSMVLMAIGFGR